MQVVHVSPSRFKQSGKPQLCNTKRNIGKRCTWRFFLLRCWGWIFQECFFSFISQHNVDKINLIRLTLGRLRFPLSRRPKSMSTVLCSLYLISTSLKESILSIHAAVRGKSVCEVFQESLSKILLTFFHFLNPHDCYSCVVKRFVQPWFPTKRRKRSVIHSTNQMLE